MPREKKAHSREKLSRKKVILDEDLRVLIYQGTGSTNWLSLKTSELCQCINGKILNFTSIKLIVSLDYKELLA